VTPAEQGLLLAVFRWARTEGVERYTLAGTLTWGTDQWRVLRLGYGLLVTRGAASPDIYYAKDLPEAVDLLASLGVIPAKFSTSYRAGYEACMEAHHIAQGWADNARGRRGWQDPEIYAMLPAADHELAVRR
jgi:hypothetical protein